MYFLTTQVPRIFKAIKCCSVHTYVWLLSLYFCVDYPILGCSDIVLFGIFENGHMQPIRYIFIPKKWRVRPKMCRNLSDTSKKNKIRNSNLFDIFFSPKMCKTVFYLYKGQILFQSFSSWLLNKLKNKFCFRCNL